MSAAVERDLKLLKAYALISSLVIGGLAITAFTPAPQKTRFGEIDVERINLVEKDGALRLVISNAERSPGPVSRGKPFGYAGGTRPGLIFYNEEGSEDGGLTWSGKTADGKVSAHGLLAFDQYDSDQAVYLQYNENNGGRIAGLFVTDQPDFPITQWVAERDSIMKLPNGPEKDAALVKLRAPRNGVPFFAQRVFAGRDRSKAAVVNLGDRQGKPRLRLMVDSLGNASVDFLDADGRVIYSLPDASRGRR